MAYDEVLAQRIREILRDSAGITEMEIFGGIAFLLHGKMFAGVSGDSLMARVGPADYEQALGTAHARKMDITSRPMRGYVFVSQNGLGSNEELQSWLQRCASFVSSLPEKSR
jgi:hypothetical protein